MVETAPGVGCVMGMSNRLPENKPEKPRKSSWWWPGVIATSLAGVAVMAIRGCWHSRMSWPLGARGYSYQVCLNCGAMRLFDEESFRPYGPVRYSLDALIAWDNSKRQKAASGQH